jgi:hypothetical protein
MSHYIYSTMTAGVNYTGYKDGGGDMKVKTHHVAIMGGANNAILNTNHTPLGSCTEVSDEDFAFLQENHTFKEHVKNGFITTKPKEVKIEKAIADIKPKDGSAPKVPGDFKKKKVENEDE